jgi:hypothetical protein
MTLKMSARSFQRSLACVACVLASVTTASDAAAASSERRFEFAIGVQPTYFVYVESLEPPHRSTETAAFTAGLAQVAYRFGQASYLEVNYVQTGNVLSRYDGTSLDGEIPIVTVNTLAFRTVGARLGIGLAERLTIFTGFEQRTWNRYLSSGTGYREIYSWNKTQVGVGVIIFKGQSLQWGLEAAQRSMSAGRIRIITSENTPGGDDSEMDLGNLPGYRVAIPIRMRGSSARYFLSATPWYEYWQFGKSNAVPNATLAPEPGSRIYEPASDTRSVGVDLLVGVSF